MSGVALRYFAYPKTQENEANFLSWACPVCKGKNPKLKGGTIAHGAYDSEKTHIDGRKHPIHRFCLLSAYKHKATCPTCRIDIDVSQVISIWMKYSLSCQRFRHWLESKMSDPVNQAYAGFAFMIAGILTKKTSPFFSLGMGLQAYAVHQALQYGSSHISITRQLECLSNELIADLNNAKLEQLKSIIGPSGTFSRFRSKSLLLSVK